MKQQQEGVNDERSLLNQIKNSIFAYNGNFVEYTPVLPVVVPPVATAAVHTDSNDVNSYQHKQRSLSTYEYLYLQWKEATGNLSLKDEAADTPNVVTYFDAWFKKLWDMHRPCSTSQPQQRQYHTVVHLEEMCFYLQLLYTINDSEIKTDYGKNDDTIIQTTNKNEIEMTEALVLPVVVEDEEGRKISKKSIILLCIFFHDAIYDVHSSTNEEDSAVLFEMSFAQHTNLHPRQVRLIASYILATKHHAITDEMTTTPFGVNDNDSLPMGDPIQIFLDLDMAVLGKDPIAYDQYSKLIRGEYSFVPSNVYCAKRALILEQFLLSSRIYHTNIFYDALEERARTNLQRETQSLRQGLIPS